MFRTCEVVRARRVVIEGVPFRITIRKPVWKAARRIVLEQHRQPRRWTICKHFRNPSVLSSYTGIGVGIGPVYIVFVNDQEDMLRINYFTHKAGKAVAVIKISIDKDIVTKRLQMSSE